MSSVAVERTPESEGKNRYRNVPRNPDFTINQNWASYSRQEHSRWDRLFARSLNVLRHRACDEFLVMVDALKLSGSGIPDMVRLSDQLERMTGWRVVPVAELVPDEIFFNHLANKCFPAGVFIRQEAEMDYLREPDIFHDVFGHVPLLANPLYSDFMQAYGQAGQRAAKLGRLANLARLYWYTVEFGLIESQSELRLFGAGIISSAAESAFALADPSPHRIAFNLERVMRTKYIIDDFQKTYFVIAGLQRLIEECYQDFGPLFERLGRAVDIEPHELVEGDKVLHAGTMRYFRTRAR